MIDAEMDTRAWLRAYRYQLMLTLNKHTIRSWNVREAARVRQALADANLAEHLLQAAHHLTGDPHTDGLRYIFPKIQKKWTEVDRLFDRTPWPTGILPGTWSEYAARALEALIENGDVVRGTEPQSGRLAVRLPAPPRDVSDEDAWLTAYRRALVPRTHEQRRDLRRARASLDASIAAFIVRHDLPFTGDPEEDGFQWLLPALQGLGGSADSHTIAQNVAKCLGVTEADRAVLAMWWELYLYIDYMMEALEAAHVIEMQRTPARRPRAELLYSRGTPPC